METSELKTLQDLVVLSAKERPDKVWLREKAGKEIARKTFGRLLEDTRKVSSWLAARGEEMLEEHLNEYLRLLAQAPACDPGEKRERNRRYVDRLLAEGGAAVDSMKKLLGEEKTDRLIRRFMFDV